MRTDKLYLTDIVEAANAIAQFITGQSEDEFLGDQLRQSAVLQKLIVIGEAASKLSAEFRERHPDIPWPSIVGFRHIAVHAYFSVNGSIVWATAVQDVPLLQIQIAEIIAQEFADD